MSRYITTNKHPYFKENAEIYEQSDQGWVATFNGKDFFTTESKLKYWIKMGYIKEVEEKEFTKSDIIDFAQYYSVKDTSDYAIKEEIQDYIKDWLKQRNK